VTALARAILFLSAFLPVLPLIAIRTWDINRPLALGCLAAAAVVAICAAAVLVLLGRGTRRDVTVTASTARSESVVGFIVAYLLPASLIDGRDTSVVIVNLCAFVFLTIVAVRSQLVYLNPLLAVFGFHSYGVEVRAKKESQPESLNIIINDADLGIGKLISIAGATGGIQRAWRT
jgi:hypothetical protein